ncbi:Predicted dithiol-disulfide isomerase, DsbA family [Pseudarcicella hirudinis]|uniref:Predicted dithiol-disulfide isomerase, DsbA family n=1 Tax=Pseudarcicella hirudinis TaxID=1079859 RepID=A0A1I5UW66_9BACT|nr:ClpXP adapter SpxH family protein [Pseudarcicella hirudinis]SFP99574.1 Predicted dithiol-disulfide isomerase, DsbA family [Pseudarcicella hirudinis]
MNKVTMENPMICDIEKGICGVNDSVELSGFEDINARQKPVRIVYFTDPICSSCWGIEPQLRKLKLEYGNNVEIEYRMGGLLPSWNIYNSGGISKPSDVASHWDEVSEHYEMPIDGDVWLEDPLSSSYPPSIAFKAAQLQGDKLALAFLRRIREMVFMEKKNIAKSEHILQAVAEVGLDSEQFKQDFEGKANQLFQEDLDLAKKLGVRGFPTLFFSNQENNRLMLYGVKPYSEFELFVRTLFPKAVKNELTINPETLFSYFPSLTTKEYSVLSNITKQEAETVLSELFNQHKLHKITSKNGILWVK